MNVYVHLPFFARAANLNFLALRGVGESPRSTLSSPVSGRPGGVVPARLVECTASTTTASSSSWSLEEAKPTSKAAPVPPDSSHGSSTGVGAAPDFIKITVRNKQGHVVGHERRTAEALGTSFTKTETSDSAAAATPASPATSSATSPATSSATSPARTSSGAASSSVAGGIQGSSPSSHPLGVKPQPPMPPPPAPPLPIKLTFGAPPLPNLPGMAPRSAGTSAGASAAPLPDISARGRHSPSDVVDALMEYIPTYWVAIGAVHHALPFNLKDLYVSKNLRLGHFLKKFNFFFDTKQTLKGVEVKVRVDCHHPRKGNGDDKYPESARRDRPSAGSDVNAAADANGRGGGPVTPKRVPTAAASRLPEGSIAALVGACCPRTFTTAADLLALLPAAVTTHPQYDSQHGVLPHLERYPHVFQIVDGSVRLKPKDVAPNALSDLSLIDQPASSPLPGLAARLGALIPTETGAMVDVTMLFGELTTEEKASVRAAYRSFPRFLRLHGRDIQVSQDNLSVGRFHPVASDPDGSEEAAAAAAALAVNDGASAEGPRLPKAPHIEGSGGIEDHNASQVDVALRELYESLPLAQCALLDDMLYLVPQTTRNGLAQAQPSLREALEKFPGYFSVWTFPDDPTQVVVKRTSVNIPSFTGDELLTALLQVVPEPNQYRGEKSPSGSATSGMPIERLLRRVPLPVQRYLYRQGVSATVAQQPRLNEVFVVDGGVIFRRI